MRCDFGRAGEQLTARNLIYGGFRSHGGTPIAGCFVGFVRENPYLIPMDDEQGTFMETPICSTDFHRHFQQFVLVVDVRSKFGQHDRRCGDFEAG